MEWSAYSEAIFDTWASTESNMLVQACPGAGKTTNVAHLWGLDTTSTVYVVFNKQNQVEAQAKLPAKAGSDVLTTHSLGFKALRNTYGTVKLDDKKVIQLIRQHITPRLKRLSLPKDTTVRDLEWMLIKAVNVAKFACDSAECDELTYRHMLTTYDLESYEDMQDHISTVLEYNDAWVDVIDFADMIRLPALYVAAMPQYEHILCDEVQDFNSMQARLIAKLQGRKYCLVGDRHQAIYGFRGAMRDSMDFLAKQFACVELPLSISYRCPQSVVQEAAQIWPTIEPWEHAHMGEVRHDVRGDLMLDELRTVKDAKEALVLCRTNAPLISYAYYLLRDRIPCHVRGRSIGENLVKLVNRFEAQSVETLLVCVEEWEARECAVARLTDDQARVELVQDKAESLRALSTHVALSDHPSVLIGVLSDLFDQGTGVALSTVHKAKGLEAQRVYMLQADLHVTAQSRARSVWQREQEKNVLFVSVTRTQDVLTYC